MTEERREVDLPPVDESPKAAEQAEHLSDRPPTPSDVTEVLQLALETLNRAHRDTSEVLLSAIRRLNRENDETSELARALSVPPGESAEDE